MSHAEPTSAMRGLVIAIASLILFFPTFWIFAAVVGPNWGAGIAAVAMYIAFPVVGLKLWKAKGSNKIPPMEVAVVMGELGHQDFDISEAISIAELEDEGLHFYLAIGASHTLFLSGQYLYDLVSKGDFPSSKIRLYWHKSLGVTYGVECLGSPIHLSHKLPPFTWEQLCDDDTLEDRNIISQPIRSLVKGHA